MECSMNVLQKRLNSSIAELKSLGESLGNITTTRHQKIEGLVKSFAEARTALMGNLPNVQLDIQEQEETLALREIEVSRREKAIATKGKFNVLPPLTPDRKASLMIVRTRNTAATSLFPGFCNTSSSGGGADDTK